MVRIATVGYGYWGPNVARNLAEVEGACVAAVVDRDPARLQLAARRFPGARLERELGAVLCDPDIDAVAIATPVASHYALAIASLRAGKHVLVEKPMTETAEQSRRLVDEAHRVARVLMVDHTFVYTGAVRRIAELVKNGEIGRVYYYDALRINLGIFQSDVNVVSDLAVHDLAVLDHLLDESPSAVCANGISHFPGTPENMAYLNLFYPSGAIAHVNVNWLAPVKIRQTLIGGSRKMIVYDDMEPSEKVKVYDKGVSLVDDPERVYTMRVGYRAGDMWAPKIDVTEALRTECAHFVHCVECGETPITDGESGLRVVEVIEAATRSMRTRGQRIELPARSAPHAAEALG